MALVLRIGLPKIGRIIRRPLPKVSMRDKIQKIMKGGTKYVAIGGALSLGAEGASALVRHAEGSPNMQDSERIEFTDFGPSVFRMDSVETASKSKWPLSMITWMLITAGVCLCLCIPFLRALNVLNHHYNVRRVFGIKSLCAPLSTTMILPDQWRIHMILLPLAWKITGIAWTM